MCWVVTWALVQLGAFAQLRTFHFRSHSRKTSQKDVAGVVIIVPSLRALSQWLADSLTRDVDVYVVPAPLWCLGPCWTRLGLYVRRLSESGLVESSSVPNV